MWIFAGLLVLSYVVWVRVRHLTMVLGAFGMVVERVANRAAVQNGQPPITTPADEAEWLGR